MRGVCEASTQQHDANSHSSSTSSTQHNSQKCTRSAIHRLMLCFLQTHELLMLLLLLPLPS
jgi:hypothetical protein